MIPEVAGDIGVETGVRRWGGLSRLQPVEREPEGVSGDSWCGAGPCADGESCGDTGQVPGNGGAQVMRGGRRRDGGSETTAHTEAVDPVPYEQERERLDRCT